MQNDVFELLCRDVDGRLRELGHIVALQQVGVVLGVALWQQEGTVGMTIAVEPMINMGTWQVDFLDDDWTVVTADRKPSAHYENTILITDGAPEILSLPGGRKSC